MKNVSSASIFVAMQIKNVHAARSEKGDTK